MIELMIELRPPSTFSDFIGISSVSILGFAVGFGRWIATPSHPPVARHDDIEPSHLFELARDHYHRALDPQSAYVCAVSKGKIVGFAKWRLPAALRRPESLQQLIWRKTITYTDAVRNRLFPHRWRNEVRIQMYRDAELKHSQEHFGKSNIGNMWQLQILVVHPDHQKNGVGTDLLQWGLKQVQERGEKVYVEASIPGKQLYSKNGFDVVGEMTVADGADKITSTWLLWSPKEGRA